MDPNLQSWALPRIKRLLPLDDDSLLELLTYSTSLSKAEGAEHLKNLLGDSAAALGFISSFSSRRRDASPSAASKSASILQSASATASPRDSENEGVPKARRQAGTKFKAPLHTAGPVRRPDGYGDVSGGYLKTSSPDALQLPKVTQAGRVSPGLSSTPLNSSRDASPMGIPSGSNSPARLPPSAAGNMISDFMPNVRSKQAKPKLQHQQQPPSQLNSGSSTPRLNPSSKATNTKTTSSISDLTSAIAALEVSTNPTLTASPNNPSAQPRKCSCAGTLHPLFTPAPNCLSCGKVICSLEGLQPCSFCGSAIISPSEVQSMIRSLRSERGQEKQAFHNAGIASSRPGGGTHSPDSGLSSDESSARVHRDKLLSYQSQNAQRTRIHDEAADFDAGFEGNRGTQWMSAVERAAALKKQQAYLREMEEMGKGEWEREKTVVSLGVNSKGKLVKTYKKVRAEAPVFGEGDEGDEQGEVPGEDGGGNVAGGQEKGKFSNNPLLQSGGLIRPIWKPQQAQGKEDDLAGITSDIKGKSKLDEASSERKSMWRRVQDDTEDNEQWILDGGLRGYGTESRTMEDGSQQECG